MNERLRVGPFREGAFRSKLHDERTAALLGIALGVAFAIMFVTGLLSHLIQHPPGWFHWPSRPAWLYRVTQGLHVATGFASVPLVFAKLWVAYPRLFHWPPVESVAHAVERLSLVPLVGGALFMVITGVMNVVAWEPWSFFFPVAHYWSSWITIGALLVHVGAKAAVVRRSVFAGRASRALSEAAARHGAVPAAGPGALGRRGFLTAVAGASAALTVATLGQTWSALRHVSMLAPRDPRVGPQGVPVNKTARSARVLQTARDPGYLLRVGGNVATPLALSLDDLRSMPSHTATLTIACVQGWSSTARWRGVRVRDLLDRAGAPPNATVLVESLQPAGQYRASTLNSSHANDRDTLLAYDLFDEPLDIDHGFPVRLIGPNRPGVMQTKWVSTLTVR